MSDATVGDKSPPPPLPAELTRDLPSAREIIKHIVAIEKLTSQLEREMQDARKRGAIPLARCFTVFHRLMSVMSDKLKPLSAVFETFKVLHVPEAFETAGVTHVPLDIGYRVQVSYILRASIRKDMRDEAYKWLHRHHKDMIVETVNASSLSALARTLREEQNKALPDRYFNIADVPNTSVVRS